jgi:type II secretory pathway component PulM
MGEMPKPSMHGLTGEQRRYVQDLEALAGARSIGVSRNNKFPYWNVDRWIGVLTFLTVIFGGIWVAGRQWQMIESALEQLHEQVSSLSTSMHEIQAAHADFQNQIDGIQRVDEYYRTNPRTPPHIEAK